MASRDLDRIRFVTRHFNELRGLRYGVPLGLMTLSLGGTTYFSNGPFQILRAALLLLAVVLIAGAGAYYRRTFGEVEQQPVRPASPLESLSIYSPAGATLRLHGSRGLPPLARRLLIATTLAFVFLMTLRSISPAVVIDEDESLVQPPWLSLGVVAGRLETSAPPEARVEAWRSTLKEQLLYLLYGTFFLSTWLWRGRRLSQGSHLAFGALLVGLAAFGATFGRFLEEGPDSGIARVLVKCCEPAVAHLWIALVLCGTAMIVTGLLDHWQIVRVLKPAPAPGAFT
ncbi:MAG TPA: hypothetical protein VIE43_13190 [Thermoanaerobaculia bacterium]|jgi:hypothetical protein|nr:hypothetical protein [Thermoanaerobaculia bacterium]